MRNFIVRYCTPSGSSLIQNIHGRGALEIKEKLMQEGYMPLFVIPNVFLDMIHPLQNGGMKDKELFMFFMELYQLTYATGSVVKAFSYMNKGNKKPAYNAKHKIIYGFKWLYYNHKKSKLKNKKRVIKHVISMLDKGQTPKEAFASNYFDEIVLSLVDLGSSTGDYPQIFLKISEYFDTKDSYKKSIAGAVAYPVFLFFLLFVAFLIFLYYIIPTFASFFSQFPHIGGSTKNVLNLFLYIKTVFVYYVIFTGLMLVLLALNLWGIKTKVISFIINIPQIGNIFKYNYLNWFFYQFSIMISSGLTITAILDYFRRNISNPFFKQEFDVTYAKLTGGFTLHESLNDANFLGEDAIESIEYAEIGGFLPEAIMRLSKEFKEKSNLSVKLFTKGLFFLAMVSVVIFLLLMFFVLFLPLIQGMVNLSGSY